MNNDKAELLETAHSKDILQMPQWTSLAADSNGNIVESHNDFTEPEKVKISIPINIKKQILDRYTDFLKMPCKVNTP